MLFVLVVTDDIVVVVEQYFFVIALQYVKMNLFLDNQYVQLPMLDDELRNQLEDLDHLLMNHNLKHHQNQFHLVNPRTKNKNCDPYGLSTNADITAPSYRIYGS